MIGILEQFTEEHLTEYQINNYPYPLKWNNNLGIGYLHSAGYDYGEEYWGKCRGFLTDLGTQLSIARSDFVKKNISTFDNLCDVGIGSGQFVEMTNCKGYNVNTFAKEWLNEHGKYADVYTVTFDALSFWDVLEHIDNPTELLIKTNNIFVSIPVYKDVYSCLSSKHLRPGEHIWHFTDIGIKNFMSYYGFDCKDSSNFETDLGREDIRTYYFSKVK